MHNKIYLKIFLSFLVVISFYTLVIAAAIVRNAYTTQRNDTINQIQTSFGQNANIVDGQFLAANNAVRTLADDASSKDLAASRPTSYSPYSRVYNDIVSNPYFVNYDSQYFLGLTTHFADPVISSDGYFTFNDYLKFLGIADRQVAIKQFFTQSSNSDIKIIDNKKHVVLLRTMRYARTTAKLFFIVTWDKQSLLPSSIFQGKGQFLLLDTLNRNINVSLPGASSIENQLSHETSNTPVILQRQINRKNYFVRQSSVIPTALLTYVLPSKYLTRVPKSLLSSLFGYFLLLLAVGSLLLVWLSRRSFRPYARIIDEVQQIDANVRPETAEALLERIHHLVTDNHTYATMQSDVVSDLKMLFLKNLLLDSYPKKEIQKFSRIIPLDELKTGGVIGLIIFSGISESEEPLSVAERISARKKAIKALWPGQLNLLFDIDTNHYALILHETTTEKSAITLNQISARLTQSLKLSVYSLISTPYKTIYQIPGCFADVYRTITPTAAMLTTPENNRLTNDIVFNLATETQIITNIDNGNFDKARALLNQTLVTILDESDITLAVLADTKLIMLNTLKRVLTNENISLADYTKENQSTLNSLALQTDPKDVHRCLMTLFASAMKISQTIPPVVHRSLEEHITDYINRRYQTDLGLAEIAEHYNLSESYTSRVIKNHLGISFKDYLAQIRIRQAKYELLNSSKKVAEVAQSVGYKNVNTFIRVFKESTGETPGKYRQNQGE